ncbi:MAG: hypothetical protein U9N84_10785, partial [Actinomycetota bacterium]|nr:hypothetical protein [Actinomycetota bacterium]
MARVRMTTLALTSPYLGPRPFDDDDADRARFFARDAEADEIVALILGHTLTVVYAQSGAGKTSIFNAAVLPRLRSEGFATLPLTRVSGEIPDDLDAALGLNPYILNTITGLAPDAPASDLAAHSLGDYLAEAGGDSNAQVLVVDQFEEIFTQSTAEGHVDRNEFFSELADAIASDPLLRVVLVLREEYIAQLEPYARFFAERLRIRF